MLFKPVSVKRHHPTYLPITVKTSYDKRRLSRSFSSHASKTLFVTAFTVCILFIILPASGYSDFISPGKLTKSHGKLEGIRNCIKCHSIGKGIPDNACKSCHEKFMERIRNKKGFHAVVRRQCIECHTEHKGEDYDITQFDTKKFDHKITGYKLQGKHETDCNKCHITEKTYLGLSPDCLQCHTDVHRKTLSSDCLQCHQYTDWKKARFDHSKSAAFILSGKHTEVKCEGCHPRSPVQGKSGDREILYQTLDFKPLKFGKCSDCHLDVHRGELKEKTCSKCHSTDGWKKAAFEHNNPRLSDFRLEGKHSKIACKLCHPKEIIVLKSDGSTQERHVTKLKAIRHENCSDCHFDVHRDQFINKDCNSCHTVKEDWKKFTFRHNSDNYKGFKLEGRHKKVDCQKCHERKELNYREFGKDKTVFAGNFQNKNPQNCDNCHFDVHKGQFSDRKCNICHTANNEWKQHSFRHDSLWYKGFKLEGKHKNVECNKCHSQSEIQFKEHSDMKRVVVGKFKPVKAGKCEDCHFDVHKDQFRDQRCDNCHTVDNDWKQHKFRHDYAQYTGFKLEGKHKKVSCENCHARSQITYTEFNEKKRSTIGKFRPLDYETCSACHKDIHNSKYEQSCNTCHTADSWKPKEFLHDPISFELTGAHNTIECVKCHNNVSIYSGLESDCGSCHNDNHNNQFSRPCRDCHRQITWVPVDFKHTREFTLTGIHKVLDCTYCHANGSFINTPSDCYICHQKDYQSAPDHAVHGYPNDCTACHISSFTWEEARYNHSSFNFSGAHAILKNDCSRCHGASRKLPSGTTDSDCYNCHSTAGPATSSYEETTAPSHTSLGFSYICEECHSLKTWVGAKFTHQSFQLKYAHLSVDCTGCHSTSYPGQYAGTSEDDCYACHASQHASQHPDFPQDCTQCHSNNTWTGASFNHESFTLIGTHNTFNCDKCHKSGYPGQYAGVTEDDCFVCHENNYYKKHQTCPHDCTLCHNIYNWGNPDEGLRKSLGCK